MFGSLADLARVILALPRIELGRRTYGPAPLLARLRSQGRRRRLLDGSERSRLRRVISSVDAHMPDGGNCYRRVLLEIALDPQAADEPVYMGLDAGGAPMSGHAWLGSDAGQDPVQARRSYDAIISL